MNDTPECAVNAAVTWAEYLRSRVESTPRWRWLRRYRLQGRFLEAADYLHFCALKEGITDDQG